jgi:succinate-semialdehyde dehydrogenase/glutarate-semialdehyde dehydrogenase
MTIATINPATGKTLRTFDSVTHAELERRLGAAADAFQLWRRRPVAERAAIVARASDVLLANREDYAQLMTTEMGKLLAAARDEVDKCALGCRYFAEHAARFIATEPGESAPTDSLKGEVRFQAIGPVLAIMPWNFPFWQVIRFAAPALCAGNVGLLKHASNVPQCALALEELFLKAGAPPGVFQTLLLESARVARVIADERVVAVTLTGSEGAGRAVAAVAGQHLKKTVLELGGSDPFIVMPTADLAQAVEAAVKARVINNGQSCIAAKRFIVAESVVDEFTARFADGLGSLRIGDPMDSATQLGPLATPAIVLDLVHQVTRSIEAGARSLGSGGPVDRPGSFFGPLVLVDVPADAPAARDELFGPVGSVFRAPDAEHAVRIANDSNFGLGASVWTRDPAEAEYFVGAIEAGQVFVNSMVVSDPRYPFGGIKRSGYGRELSSFGLREFTNIKTIRRAAL